MKGVLLVCRYQEVKHEGNRGRFTKSACPCFVRFFVLSWFSNQASFICSPGEENQKEDKNLAKHGLSNERKSLEINNDTNETVNEAISNGTGMTSHSSDTALNESETKSEPQTSEEGNTTKTIENENSKQKGGTDEKKPKEGKRRGKHLSFKLLKDRALKKKLQRQFRGAKKESLAKLSAARLASYGLEMKKKKKT